MRTFSCIRCNVRPLAFPEKAGCRNVEMSKINITFLLWHLFFRTMKQVMKSLSSRQLDFLFLFQVYNLLLRHSSPWVQSHISLLRAARSFSLPGVVSGFTCETLTVQCNLEAPPQQGSQLSTPLFMWPKHPTCWPDKQCMMTLKIHRRDGCVRDLHVT